MNEAAESTITAGSTTTGTATRTQVTTIQGGAMTGAVIWGLTVWQRAGLVAQRVTRWCRDTITPAGWCAFVAVVVAAVFGLAWGWTEALAAGVAAAVLLILALVFLLGANAYSIETDLTDMRVVAGNPITGSIFVKNVTKRFVLPGMVDVPVGDGVLQLSVPLLRAGVKHKIELKLPTERRGILEVGPVTTVRGDPVGMLRRETAWTQRYQLFVHPKTTTVPSTSMGFIRDLEGNPSTAIVDSDISFHAIREYAPGDSQRHINWKSTAKTGTLMVRQYEETRRSRLVLVLGVNPAEYGTDDEFELAVSALGSLGVRAIQDGRDVSVITSHAAPAVATTTVRSIDTLPAATPRILLDTLSGVDVSQYTMPLLDVCSLAAEAVPDISIALLFVGSSLTANDLKRAALRFPVGTQIVAVIANPEAEPRFGMIGDLRFMSIALLDDFRHLMARGATA